MRTAHGFAWKQSFLDRLREVEGNVTRAADLSGVSKGAVYKRAKREPQFGRELSDVLAAFPYRRGTRRPILT